MPEFTTVALLPACNVVTVPIEIFADCPVAPVSPCGPRGPVSPRGPRGPVSPRGPCGPWGPVNTSETFVIC